MDTRIGFFLAGALLPSIAYFLSPKTTQSTKIESLHDSDNEDDDSEDDEFLGERDSTVDPTKWGIKDAPYKMILIVNKSLKMGKGKIAAQCCHAAVGCYKKSGKDCPAALRAWELTGCAKVAVNCSTEDEMNVIMGQAYSKGITHCFIEDAGRTQIAAGSRTVLGLGPAPVSAFEGITDHLKLM